MLHTNPLILVVIILFNLIVVSVIVFTILNISGKQLPKLPGNLKGNEFVPLIVGLCFIMIGLFFVALFNEDKTHCTVPVNATFFGTEEVYTSDGKGGTYKPVYKFRINGDNIITAKGSIGMRKILITHKKGSIVPIYYDPDNPEHVYDPALNHKTSYVIYGFLIFGCFFFMLFFVDIILKISGHEGYVK